MGGSKNSFFLSASNQNLFKATANVTYLYEFSKDISVF